VAQWVALAIVHGGHERIDIRHVYVLPHDIPESERELRLRPERGTPLGPRDDRAQLTMHSARTSDLSPPDSRSAPVPQCSQQLVFGQLAEFIRDRSAGTKHY
jgi:hypothetical protein